MQNAVAKRHLRVACIYTATAMQPKIEYERNIILWTVDAIAVASEW